MIHCSFSVSKEQADGRDILMEDFTELRPIDPYPLLRGELSRHRRSKHLITSRP